MLTLALMIGVVLLAIYLGYLIGYRVGFSVAYQAARETIKDFIARSEQSNEATLASSVLNWKCLRWDAPHPTCDACEDEKRKEDT